MNKKVKRTCLWGVVILVYIFLYLISFLHVPMSLFLRMLPPIVIIGLLTRGKPLWVKGVVSCTLVIAGVYTLFYNDILGPIGFMIRDMPIDMPAQFYHSWRYYWIVCYLYEVIWRWFWPSAIFLIIFTLYRRTKDRTDHENNSSKINNARKACEDL